MPRVVNAVSTYRTLLKWYVSYSEVTYQEFVDALGHYLGDPWRSKPYDLIHLVSPCAVVVNFTSSEAGIDPISLLEDLS